MQVIPAIDVLDGKVVRLRQGDFTRVREYDSNPVTLAERYASEGAGRIHVVNLSAAKRGEQEPAFVELVRTLAGITGLSVQAGGGVRSLRDVSALLEAGADRVVLGTALFTDPAFVRGAIMLFGRKRFVAALDVRGGEVCIRGWRENTGTTLNAALRQIAKLGIEEALITDIERDGMDCGPNVGLYEQVRLQYPNLRVIASGGVRGVQDIRALSVCDAVIIGKALLDGRTTIQNLQGAGRSDLAVRVIPCLDVAGGRVVKGTSFRDLRDAGDPVELAKKYCVEGADELVFLDITATVEDRETVYELVSRVSDVVNIPFTIGGGVRSVDDARRLLDVGADKVSVNSAAVESPALLSKMAARLGSANTVCAIDAKRKGSSWTVLVSGGREDTDRDALEWAEEAATRGAGELLVTSYDQDGTGEGFDVALLREIKRRVQIPLIASGGAGSLETFVSAVRDGGADAVLAAGVFHFGKLAVSDVKSALRAASFPVRP